MMKLNPPVSATTLMGLFAKPILPYVIKLTYISFSLLGKTGPLLYLAFIHPHNVLTLKIYKGVSPIFLNLKIADTVSFSFAVPKLIMESAHLITE